MSRPQDLPAYARSLAQLAQQVTVARCYESVEELPPVVGTALALTVGRVRSVRQAQDWRYEEARGQRRCHDLYERQLHQYARLLTTSG